MRDIQKRFDNVSKSKTFNKIVNFFDLKSKKVLDIGCGYGEHLVHFGKGSTGITIDLKEVEYAQNNNLNVLQGNAESFDGLGIEDMFDVIWANNFFEHILSPHSFLMKLKTVSRHGTLLIIGVPVVPKIASLLKLRKFRGALAVSHTNFFTKETLVLTLERSGWKVRNVRSFVFKVFLLDRLFGVISPHVYVVAENDIDFKYHEKKLAEWEGQDYYKSLLDITNQ